MGVLNSLLDVLHSYYILFHRLREGYDKIGVFCEDFGKYCCSRHDQCVEPIQSLQVLFAVLAGLGRSVEPNVRQCVDRQLAKFDASL